MIGAGAGWQGEQHGEGMRAFWSAAVGLSLPGAGCLLEPVCGGHRQGSCSFHMPFPLSSDTLVSAGASYAPLTLCRGGLFMLLPCGLCVLGGRRVSPVLSWSPRPSHGPQSMPVEYFRALGKHFLVFCKTLPSATFN